jgi:hypothetical protein
MFKKPDKSQEDDKEHQLPKRCIFTLEFNNGWSPEKWKAE